MKRVFRHPLPEGSAKDRHLYWLDWVRFTAAFMVVTVHARGFNWAEWAKLEPVSKTPLVATFFAITRAGTEWVMVFFVLSGFLVGGKLIERVMTNSFRLRDYAIDRFTRIWIPLSAALVWSAIAGFWAGKSISAWGFAGNLLGLQGGLVSAFADNGPLWSLGYEIWFYFLAGSLAVWLTATERGRVAATLFLAIGLAVFTTMKAAYLFAWVLGAATYWLCNRPRNLPLALLGGLMLVSGFVCSQLASATDSVDTRIWLSFVPSEAVATLMLSLGVALLFPFLTKLKPQTETVKQIDEWGGKLAAFSYTLYLTHYPLLYLWDYYSPSRHTAINPGSVGAFIAKIASCLLFAWICYLPFEKQTGRARRWLRNAWTVGGTGASNSWQLSN